MKRALAALRQGWGWTGVDFAEIVAASRMGHLLLADGAGVLHYLDTDMRVLTRLGSDEDARAHFADPEVEAVWHARALVEAAEQRLGALETGEVYSLTVPAMIEGDYAPENLVRLPLAELLRATGDLERQMRDMPEGVRVQVRVTN